MKRLAPLLMVVLVAAGCVGTGETTENIYENPAVIAPYLQGLSRAQAADYVEWFNTAQLGDQLGWSSRPSIVGAEGAEGDAVPEKPAFDPSCPLNFAYEFNATGGSAYKPGLDPLSDQLEIPETFFNANRQETLFFLSGSKRVGGAGGSSGCADAYNANGREVVYLPVRIRFDTGDRPLWIIEGFTNPAATIDIAVDSGPEPLKLSGDLNRIADEVKAVYALPRMRRFVMTNENATRILEYAKIGQSSGPARRIIWFRTADLAPYYRSLASGNCSAAVLAFWDVSSRKSGQGNSNGGLQGEAQFDTKGRACSSEQVLPAGEEGKTEEDSGKKRGTAWIDPQGRYVAAIKSDGSNRDDDACAEFGCVPVSNDQWDEALDSLYYLASTANENRNSDPNSAARNAALNKLYDILQGAEARDANRIPASLGGDGGAEGVDGGYRIPADVFPVLASGGAEAWTRLQKGYAGGGDALRATISYTGRADGAEWSPDQSNADPVTITPTFRLVENDPFWYDRNSLIFGTGTFLTRSAVFTTGDTDRTGGTVELPVRRSPVAKITIKITDTIRQQVNSTYTSTWLPLYAVGSFWATKVDLDACGAFDILCYIRRAIDWLIESALRNTIGELMGSLAKGTAGNLLAIPSIEPYEIAEVYNGQVRYRVYDEVRDYLRAGSDKRAEYIRNNPNIPAKCFEQAAQISDSNLAQWSDCYKSNGMYGLFTAARALMLVLFLFYTARFFLNLMANRERQMNITSFFARAGISAFLILYIGFLLRMMGLVVAEVILLTNLLGTMVTGESYSHLWLFQTYINPPSGLQGIQALTDFIGMAFSLLGMLVLSIAGWLRLGLTTVVILISPLWIVNIMSARTPEFFYKSLFWIIRLWIIPMITLLMLLLLFLGVKLIDPSGNGPQTGLIGMLAMIVIAIVPWRLSAAVIKKGSERIRSSIQSSLEQQSNDGMDRLLQAGLAGGSDTGGGGRGGGTLGGGGGKGGNQAMLDQARGKGGKGGKGGGAGGGEGGAPGTFSLPGSKMLGSAVNQAVVRPKKCPDCGGKWGENGRCVKCGKGWSLSPKSIGARAAQRVGTQLKESIVEKTVGKNWQSSTSGVLAKAALDKITDRLRSGASDNPSEAMIRVGSALSQAPSPKELTTAERNAKRWERQAQTQEEIRNKHAYDLNELRANSPESVKAYTSQAMSWRNEASAAREARDAEARAAAQELGVSAANDQELQAALASQRAQAEAELAERRAAAERFGVDPTGYTAEAQARLNRIAAQEARMSGVRERHAQVLAARPTRPSETADGSAAWFKEREKARKGIQKANKKHRDAIAERDKWNGFAQAQAEAAFGPSPRAERADSLLESAPAEGEIRL